MTTKGIKIIILLLFTSINCVAQQTTHHKLEIENAKQELNRAFLTFFDECLSTKSCQDCVTTLSKQATTPYTQYLIGGALYNIDAKQAFLLHEKAYKQHPFEQNFILEYAIELHRKGLHQKAIPLYHTYLKAVPKDYRAHVWLSECYLNQNNTEKAIHHWKEANWHNHKTGVDKALHLIHQRTDQMQKRSDLRTALRKNNAKSAYELIYLDLNWEHDWWNSMIQLHLLEEDLQLIRSVFGKNSEVHQDLAAYAEIKQQIEKSKTPDQFNAVKQLFEKPDFALNRKQLILCGKALSDLVNVATMVQAIDEKQFFEEKGKTLLRLADQEKDVEFLNVYAHLEAKINGKVSKLIDKKGWQNFHDERFALSYFTGLGEENSCKTSELSQALETFPKSANLLRMNITCLISRQEPYEKELINLIKSEFKTLGSDPYQYSSSLNTYFYFLENGIPK